MSAKNSRPVSSDALRCGCWAASADGSELASSNRIGIAAGRLIGRHLSAGKGQLENTVVLICTALLIVIAVAGSLWVMHNANVNIMPTTMSPEQARAHD